MDNYLNMLKDSLVKKEKNLSSLIKLSEKQGAIVKEENDVDWEEFTKVADEKGVLIEEILKLDEGFEMLYDHIKEGLEDNKEKYSSTIIEIKALIKSVTEKGADLEALERRNKTAIEAAFSSTRKEIRQSKLGQKAAADYYNKMNKINTIDPQLLDRNC